MTGKGEQFLFKGTSEERSKQVDEFVDDVFDSIILPQPSSDDQPEAIKILEEASQSIEEKKALNAKAVEIVDELKKMKAPNEEVLEEIEVLEEGTDENPLVLEEVESTERKLSPAEERFRLTCQNNPDLCDRIFVEEVQNALKNRPTEALFLLDEYEQEAMGRLRDRQKAERELTSKKPISEELPVSENIKAQEKLDQALKNLRREVNVISVNLSKKQNPLDPPEVKKWQKGYRADVVKAFRNFADRIIVSPNPLYTYTTLSTDTTYNIVPQAEKDEMFNLLKKYQIDELYRQIYQGE